MGRFTGKTCRLVVMLSLTFGFFLVEIVFGYITNSMALIADSFHMLSDVLALIIAFCCMKISKKKSSKNTFGWVRAEVLGALINAVFLLALCFSIVVEALKRLIKPEEIEQPVNILIVGALGLLINIIGIFMFHGHASLHGHSHARPVPLNLPNEEGDENEELEEVEKLSPIVSQSHNISVLMDDNNVAANHDHTKKIPSSDVMSDVYSDSLLSADKQPLQKPKKGQPTKAKDYKDAAAQLNMHGVFLHILGDAFGSVIVIINAIVCIFVNNEKVKMYLDPSLSLVISLIITSTTLPLLKESALILLQTVPTHIDIQETKNKLLKSIDGVLAVHEFHVWRLAGNKIIATAHIRCHNLEDYMKIAERVKQFFHDEGIHSTTIQPEFGEADKVAVHNDDECVLECPTESQCAPSTCCGSKLISVGIGGAGATVLGNRPGGDSTFSNNSANDASVLFGATSMNPSHKGAKAPSAPPPADHPPYPSMIAQHPTSTPTRHSGLLQRRMSKSEDNLSTDFDKNNFILPTYDATIGACGSDSDKTKNDLDASETVSFSKEANVLNLYSNLSPKV